MSLPIDQCLPELLEKVLQRNNIVLQAPPGAGKTTRVPLALLNEPWLAGRKIIMLEPRRLAARNAAHFMAGSLGEKVGDTVGYRVRLDSKIGPATRIEVVTEGILTRMLQDDPALEDVALVIFDEFHERSLQADLGLALCLESQAALREDLKLLVMSATLDGAAVARLLGNAPIVTSSGRSYPVDIYYDAPPAQARFEQQLQHRTRVISWLVEQESGSMLVFLPGTPEIRRQEQALVNAKLGEDVLITPLYGELSLAAQETAIRPCAAGKRKIVLATNIAESSLTIEGIRIVVDSGLARVPRYNPNSGLTRLETVNISQASATQRSGRAGRLEAGACYRLWPESRSLLAQTDPEICDADLSALALELAQWGCREADELQWLTPPSAGNFHHAQALLQQLGALDGQRRITDHGRQMNRLALHPRLSHMVLKAKPLGAGVLACQMAALLSERDIFKRQDQPDCDLRSRLQFLNSQKNNASCQRLLKSARQWQRQLGITDAVPDLSLTGVLLGLAYPDRIAKHRSGSEPRYQLANGGGAKFWEFEALANEPYLVVAQLDGREREARIFLAAAIDAADLEAHFSELIEENSFVRWDEGSNAVQALRQRRLGELVLEEKPINKPDPELICQGLIQGIRQRGLDCLPWTKQTRNWCHRVALLHRLEEDSWPDVSDARLLATLEDWLAPFLVGMSRLSHLTRLDLHAALNTLLKWPQQQQLDQLAPTHIQVPTGSRIAIDYDNDPPILAVRIQEMFGATETPSIANGRIKLLLHLLSPAQRPMQVTQDLVGFWSGSYAEVKKDMKGRYPKHYWPDDPRVAEPTRRAKPRR